MKDLEVTCQKCGQVLIVQVDEAGLEFIGEERLKSLAKCQRCVDLDESKKRSEYFARKTTRVDGQPF